MPMLAFNFDLEPSQIQMDKYAGSNFGSDRSFSTAVEAVPSLTGIEAPSVEFSISQFDHGATSRSKSPRETPSPSIDQRHNQLMGQIDRLVRAQNSWQVDRQKLEMELRESRSQMKRLRDENDRLRQLIEDKDALYEELREQLYHQLATIEKLEQSIRKNSFEGELKEVSEQTLSSTFCTQKLEETPVVWPTHETSWKRLEDSIAQDLGNYIDIKLQHTILQRKLEEREQELSELRLQLEELYRQRRQFRSS